MGRHVTSFDVARAAGVSQPTVSRALRNLPGTSPETRARVLTAAEELSYVVRDSARVLSTTRTRRVAVVAEELTNPYYAELVEPLRKRLAHHNLRTVIVTDSPREEVTLDSLTDGSYDGVVLTTTLRRSTLPRDLTERGVPHVLVNRVLDHPESRSCTVDNLGGMRQVADLLYTLGHRNIAVLNGPVETSTGRQRSEALRDALKAHGLRLPRFRVRRSRFTHDEARGAAAELLELSPRPTAIVCGNDVIALGVLSSARQAGLDVPRDLTVIGFDDIPMAAWPLIDLTTVRCDLDVMAARSIDLLVEEIAVPRGSPRHEIVATKLVERGTHAAPPDVN